MYPAHMQDEAGQDRAGSWKFIGQPLEVTVEGEPPQPVAFSWAGNQFKITDILVSWFDWGFPAGAKQRDWRTRRHRRYFRVATVGGEIFEIYHDRRGAGQGGDWVCYQQWVPE